MSLTQLALSNVINISVSQPGAGLLPYNTSNLAIFTRDTSTNTTNNNAGYGVYLNPTAVGLDYGTSSTTYLMANAIFSQQPNILAGNGALIIIPFLTTAQNQQVKVTFPGNPPTSGSWLVKYNSIFTSALASNATAAQLQTALQAVSGLSSATVTGSMAAGFSINAGTSGVGFPFTVYPQYTITCTSANATLAATYTDSNSNTYTVAATIAGSTTLKVAGTVNPAASGTLTKVTGTGDASITYSAVASPLQDASANTIFPSLTLVVPGSTAETLDQAINRTAGLVQYFGCMASEITTQIVQQAAAATVQALNKLLFVVSYTSADIAVGGMLDLLRSGGFTQTRGLFYDDSTVGGSTLTGINAVTFMAAYASRGLSTNFNGSNTTSTMHMKSLAGIQPDPGITQTLLAQAIAAGADTYASYQGVAKVYCSGLNDYFDNQYNLQWLAGALQVAGFNVLATNSTKLPQTESGMNSLKQAYIIVLEQALSNGFLAPGSWTSGTYFGNQADLLNAIANRGYYVYSSPVSQQLPSVRTTRAAPLIQIACKYAGAIQSSSVIVTVNP